MDKSGKTPREFCRVGGWIVARRKCDPVLFGSMQLSLHEILRIIPSNGGRRDRDEWRAEQGISRRSQLPRRRRAAAANKHRAVKAPARRPVLATMTPHAAAPVVRLTPD